MLDVIHAPVLVSFSIRTLFVILEQNYIRLYETITQTGIKQSTPYLYINYVASTAPLLRLAVYLVTGYLVL